MRLVVTSIDINEVRIGYITKSGSQAPDAVYPVRKEKVMDAEIDLRGGEVVEVILASAGIVRITILVDKLP